MSWNQEYNRHHVECVSPLALWAMLICWGNDISDRDITHCNTQVYFCSLCKKCQWTRIVFPWDLYINWVGGYGKIQWHISCELITNKQKKQQPVKGHRGSIVLNDPNKQTNLRLPGFAGQVWKRKILGAPQCWRSLASASSLILVEGWFWAANDLPGTSKKLLYFFCKAICFCFNFCLGWSPVALVCSTHVLLKEHSFSLCVWGGVWRELSAQTLLWIWNQTQHLL